MDGAALLDLHAPSFLRKTWKEMAVAALEVGDKSHTLSVLRVQPTGHTNWPVPAIIFLKMR